MSLKDNILQAISEAYPYPLETVKKVYEATRSYDRTIIALNIASANAKNPIELVT